MGVVLHQEGRKSREAQEVEETLILYSEFIYGLKFFLS